jgi:hypothetical protein
MRTSLVLDDDLVQQAKHLAVDRKLTLSEFVNQAIRAELAGTSTGKIEHFSMVTFGLQDSTIHHEPNDFASYAEEDDRQSLGRD